MHGVCHDTLNFVTSLITTELNRFHPHPCNININLPPPNLTSATDNPMVFATKSDAIIRNELELLFVEMNGNDRESRQVGIEFFHALFDHFMVEATDAEVESCFALIDRSMCLFVSAFAL